MYLASDTGLASHWTALDFAYAARTDGGRVGRQAEMKARIEALREESAIDRRARRDRTWHCSTAFAPDPESSGASVRTSSSDDCNGPQ